MKSILVNVTLPENIAKYLDDKAQDAYTTRATVARQFLIEHIEEKSYRIKTKRIFYKKNCRSYRNKV